ncbi:MAG: hypothetical protein JNM83_08840, partial [Myxococcales bacterium]|nr:hypothetical protein [Myxococcales bacterium]
AVASWDSYDKDTQRRLRNLRDDTDDALSAIKAYQSRGEQIRGRLPLPMDAQLGLALVNPSTATPEIIPTTTKLTRPAFDEESVQDLSFPPRTGTYDGSGKVSELGEMTRTFVALCLQETRAFIEGLAQEKSPSQAGLLQVNRVARSLVATVSQLNLSTAQYQTAWQKLFSGLLPNTPTTDPHAGTPTIGTPNGANNVASVAFISGNTKTDRAMRIRVQAGVGNVSAQTDVVTITFASEWKDQVGNPVVPAIICSQGAYASVSTSTAFTLQLGNVIGGGNAQDFSIIVSGGSSANSN